MTLTELIAAVERGETGRNIREGVALALGWKPEMLVQTQVWRRPDRSFVQSRFLPEWDTSIDAQAALPGRIENVMAEDEGYRAEAITPARTWAYGTAPTEPAARLAALLRAMQEDGR